MIYVHFYSRVTIFFFQSSGLLLNVRSVGEGGVFCLDQVPADCVMRRASTVVFSFWFVGGLTLLHFPRSIQKYTSFFYQLFFRVNFWQSEIPTTIKFCLNDTQTTTIIFKPVGTSFLRPLGRLRFPSSSNLCSEGWRKLGSQA